jgi:hypothetical protein
MKIKACIKSEWEGSYSLSTSEAIRLTYWCAAAQCLVEATVINVDAFCDDVDVGIKKSMKPILFVEIEIGFQKIWYHVTIVDKWHWKWFKNHEPPLRFFWAVMVTIHLALVLKIRNNFGEIVCFFGNEFITVGDWLEEETPKKRLFSTSDTAGRTPF